MKEINDDIAHFEWELLRKEISLTYGFDEVSLSNGESTVNLVDLDIENVRFWRDDDYQLNLEISGNGDIKSKLIPRNACKSLLWESIRICVVNRNRRYEFSECDFINPKRDSLGSVDKKPDNFSLLFHVHKIHSIFQESVSPIWLNEWYINGPSDPFIFTQGTEVTKNISYTLKRSTDGSEFEYIPLSSGFPVFSEHNIYIQSGGISPSFILSTVPKVYAKTNTANLRVEYNTKFGEIPDEKIRKSVADITGFVVGKQLINLGYTCYDEHGDIVEFAAYTPSSNLNLRGFGRFSPYFPPININVYRGGTNISIILPKLINEYLKVQKDYYLSDVLSRYWLGINMPAGINIPILQNCLEILTKCILEGNPKIDLYESKRPKDMCKGFKNCFPKLCSKLNISLSPVEHKALNLRNDMTHSLRILDDFTNEELEEEYTKYLVYVLLFHRVFLRCLDYDGKYIDYSANTKDLLTPYCDRPIYQCACCPHDPQGVFFENLHGMMANK